jgi:glutamate-1-semialdehyde 2,1-aminomutase
MLRVEEVRMAVMDRVEIDRARLRSILERERATFVERHPTSRRLAADASAHMIGGVPMQWMAMWSGQHPVFFERAKGNRIVDVDGNELIDFCLGDTGAMGGHSPDATIAAVQRRIAELGGITTMMPTEDAIWVADDLARRFGVPKWTFSLTATDANRWALRTCRQLTGRSKVLIHSYCYHGSVDETVVTLEDGVPTSKPGNVGPAVDPATTTRVVEFNDLEGLERELAHGDVACFLAEPALTNMGIVLPGPGYWEEARRLTREHGALLIIDETHTFSAGPGGCTRAWDLEPDIVVIGKSIGGGVPIGAYGVTQEIADGIAGDLSGDYVDTGGVGGTLAGNALSLAAARGTLEHVLTDEAFARMVDLGERFHRGVQAVIDRHRLPWVVEGFGARAELRFCPTMPRNGGESHAAHDDEVEEWLHLITMNRGILITPFHNMSLMCPATTADDVDRHLAILDEAAAELVA